jgi:hypothetical protein
MACTLGYIEDVKQFARLAQLKQAIKDMTSLMEDTINFIAEFTCDGQGPSPFLWILTIANSAIRIAAISPQTGTNRQARETIQSVQATIRSRYIRPVSRKFGDAIGRHGHGFTSVIDVGE